MWSIIILQKGIDLYIGKEKIAYRSMRLALDLFDFFLQF